MIFRGLKSIQVIFRSTDVIGPPINTSEFLAEPSFISLSCTGISPHAYGWWQDYAKVHASVELNTTFVSVLQGKFKADKLMAKSLNTTLLYDRNSTQDGSVTYYYKAKNASSAIQKFKDAFLEYKPNQGFNRIVTPTLLDNRTWISFELIRKTGELAWKTDVNIYCPNYLTGGLYENQTLSLRGLADYSGSLESSPHSTKSLLRISFDFVSVWPFGYVPEEKVIAFETIPSQMEISESGEVFEKDITGGSVEDLYMHFKFVRTPLADGLVWFFVIVLTAVIFGPVGLIMWKMREDIIRGFRRISKRENISVSFIRDYGIQLVAVLFTFFVIYQFRNTIVSLFLDGLASVGSIIDWFEGYDSLYLSGILSLLVAILIIVLVTTTPGFFVGLLTGGKGNGMISVALGSFLAPWVSFVYWAPEVLSLGVDVLGFVLMLELILLGTIILSLIVGGVGMLGGALGEDIAFSVRKKVLIKRKKAAAWDLKDQAEGQTTSELGYGLMELKEQLGRGDITLEEYERKKKSLEGLTELKLQLGRGDITFEEYYQKKKKLLEKPET